MKVNFCNVKLKLFTFLFRHEGTYRKSSLACLTCSISVLDFFVLLLQNINVTAAPQTQFRYKTCQLKYLHVNKSQQHQWKHIVLT